ncbi:OLC1v1001675C1 [Oldenlandia corymbosa var. corymbosa]|uniref:OLC1v1001675C1 n=1 Tax=Oldenlandia corymbosa var. corymbosa TaxID=529605 RepID=A0AAV1D991_OLDCO|nr:OLC1v1001675C1 [Oldenlandia corymbosa var. corymbosa]
MASPSSEINLGKNQSTPPPTTPSTPPPPEAAGGRTMNKGKNLHASLVTGAIEKLKEFPEWEEHCERARYIVDERKIRRVYEIQEKMDVNELLNYVMHGDGEEVVWDDDVWNVRQIKRTREDQPPPPLPTPEAKINATKTDANEDGHLPPPKAEKTDTNKNHEN